MVISVAMTTYNGIKYIKQLLDSIQNQTEKPDEVIIVDDNSSDGTYEFVNEYIARNGLNNWNNYRNEKNIGWRANFRVALKKCSGDIIFLCDQDDVWMPYKIFEMKQAMEMNSKIHLLVSNYSVLNVNRKDRIFIKNNERNDGCVKKIEFKSSSLSVLRPGCTYAVRKTLVDKMMENDLISAPHDAVLWGYAAIDDSLYLFNRKTIQFRRHSESASTPKMQLNKTRRLNEISWDIDIENFFISKCKDFGFVEKEKMLKRQLEFNKKRTTFIKNNSFLKTILLFITCIRKYPTLRNALSDIYIMLKK
jgi:glycosyltransferase involved in cell wall biosynthesis